MTPNTRTTRRWPLPDRACMLLSMLAIATLAGCGTAPNAPMAVTPVATAPEAPDLAMPQSATPILREPQFSDIVWTNEWSETPGEQPVAAAELPTDSDVIVALTRARALPAGARVDAAWTYNDTPLEAFSTATEKGDSSDDVWLAFRLERNPDLPWPSGNYAVTLFLDGAEVVRGDVHVVDAA